MLSLALDAVGVLVLIDQDVLELGLEAPLGSPAGLPIQQQPQKAQHVVEIDSVHLAHLHDG
jgi:hypothetical protein